MEIIISQSYDQMSRAAATLVARLVNSKPNAVLGLATGSTPLGMYRELARMHKDEGLDFSQVATFNLDEYVGLTKDHPQSYHYFMHENLFKYINIPPQNVYIPSGTTDNYVDAWFVGFTPSLVTGVWLGHDRPRPEGKGFTGGAAAAPIWGAFMTKALAARLGGEFVQPEGVLTLAIDPETGLPARTGCPKVQDEFFVSGTEPAELCPLHGGEPLQPPPAPLELQVERLAEPMTEPVP